MLTNNKLCRILLLFLLYLTATETYAQTFSISGRVVSAADTAGLPGATVTLKKAADAQLVNGSSADGRAFLF